MLAIHPSILKGMIATEEYQKVMQSHLCILLTHAVIVAQFLFVLHFVVEVFADEAYPAYIAFCVSILTPWLMLVRWLTILGGSRSKWTANYDRRERIYRCGAWIYI